MSFKKDEELGVSSFYQDKTSVIQEARVFNESPISPRKCRILLTKVIYLLYTGETFNRQEATTLFFGATKLFQHKDPALRQMVYLAVKELCPLADDTIMVTASIMKDMQPNMEVIYRPNAIRALSRVVDPSMVQGLERFFKSAIVDRNSSISSAALVSAYQLHVAAKEVVRRWGNEAQEAVHSKSSSGSSGFIGGFGGAGSYLGWGGGGGGGGGLGGQQGSPQQGSALQVIPSTSYITQYHALGLLYLIRQGDRMAVTKLVQQLGTGKTSSGSSSSSSSSSGSTVLRSPYAVCMLVRYAAKVADEDPNLRPLMMDMLDSWLRHKADMVNYEAARAMCDMRGITQNELVKPVAVLQLFLSAPRSTLKFAAIRTLAKLAQTHPAAVQTCNVDMENLITDNNRSIATYAITTLLKTGNEASVDRLMKQISGFMSEISDEFKVIVVDAIRSLCLKFPSKQTTMLGFLSGVLRDEGGYEFKRAVVEAIFDMIQFIGDCKEAALAHLCEFIEDCEFTKLSVRILHLLGVEGPKMAQPHKYIRYIYNRVILENAIVRAAAVNSLAKFGLEDKALTARITVLLERCLDDVDDEVRDRAAMNLRVLRESRLAQRLAQHESMFKLSALEASLSQYVAQPPASQTKRFDAAAVPRVTREEQRQEELRAKNEAASKVAMAAETPRAGTSTGAGTAAGAAAAAAAAAAAGGSAAGGAANGGGAGAGADAASFYEAQLAAVAEFADYGPLLKSASKPVELTERETEYVVSAVTHVFKDHLVVQYNVTNTLPDTVLDDVAVVVAGAEDAGLEEDFIVRIPSLSQAQPSGVVYVSFTRVGGQTAFQQGTLTNTLHFVSREVDPTTQEAEEEGYQDQYETSELELGVSTYVGERWADFNREWEQLKGAQGHEAVETFALTALDGLKAACETLVDLLGMQPLGGSELPSSTSVHTLTLSGYVATSPTKQKVLARCRMTFSTKAEGVTMELAVRGESEEAVQLIMGAIA
ncbi:putative coatomer gamma-2 subunit [Acaromyces ingoldii]|uniref:Coatomer subunit gamma n=1 Tax=Acaromyces ingoldii TaxID=215250 RepID=A0A316YKR8_9BASI|nr:putative coatomer gamma-2 subunit [Acaromyces ingoldii]PWN89809.1 putative coatomer gamma-2 subunit [Acaromyces ingoldii]